MCKETQWASFLARRVMNHLWLIAHQSLLNISLPVGIDLALRSLWCRHFWATFETNGVETTFLFYRTNDFESGVQMSAFSKQGDDPEPSFLDRTFSFQHGPLQTFQRHCGVRCAFIAEVSVIMPWWDDFLIRMPTRSNPHRWKDMCHFQGAAGLRLVMWFLMLHIFAAV